MNKDAMKGPGLSVAERCVVFITGLLNIVAGFCALAFVAVSTLSVVPRTIGFVGGVTALLLGLFMLFVSAVDWQGPKNS